jgi:hypothetical protein
MRQSLTLLVSLLLLVVAIDVAGAEPFETEASAYTAYQRADYTVALRLFRLFADRGSASAQYDLGIMYENGQGVQQNYPAAARWYGLAAAQGRADAQNNLGRMYNEGKGVPQDYRTAVMWYRLAAVQGHSDAQYNLGSMYESGDGVPQDYILAYMWYSLSAALGDKDALSNRDELAHSMVPVQLVRAQQLARDWHRTSQGIAQIRSVSAGTPAAQPQAPAGRTAPSQGQTGGDVGQSRNPLEGYSMGRSTNPDPWARQFEDEHGPERTKFDPKTDDEIIYRSHRIFPDFQNEPARQQWIVAQKQRAIANDINRTKPLMYPVNGR